MCLSFFLISKQTAFLIIIFSASKQTASPSLGETGEGGKKVLHYCLVLVTDPLYLPLKRGGLVCPYFESPRKLYKSLSASLFGKQANCLSPFRGDGRGVKIHMKKCLFHVSRHITNLFLETRNMRKQ